MNTPEGTTGGPTDGPRDAPTDAAPGDDTLARTDADADHRVGWRALIVDLTPLRHNPVFRRLYIARIVSLIGSMITFVALPAQMFAITGSSFQVGMIGLAELIPLVGAALFGGALADRIDRKLLVFACEYGMAGCTALLAWNGRLGGAGHVWVLYVFAAVAAVFDGLQRPAIEALNQQIVRREHITAANALNSSLFSFGMILGPVIGGVIISTWGFGWAFGIDSISFVLGGTLALTLPSRRAARHPDAIPDSPFADIGEGLRYAWANKALLGSYLVDINAMVFGMPLALFPAMAHDLGGASTLGWLYAGPGIGSMVMSVFGGSIPRRVARHGVGLLYAAAGWGVAVTAFGLVHTTWLAVALLAIAGAADMLSGLFRMAIWNHSIPNEIRGRLAGIEMISYSASPPLGNVESGLIAAATSVRTSIVSGGVLCVAVGGVLAVALPDLRAYRSREAPAAI